MYFQRDESDIGKARELNDRTTALNFRPNPSASSESGANRSVAKVALSFRTVFVDQALEAQIFPQWIPYWIEFEEGNSDAVGRLQ